jgi:PBSX family phage terminase large subunit
MKFTFDFKPFSKKQKKILTWWCDNSPMKDKDGIIADGAIRSGKTVSMGVSFVAWAMQTFDSCNFAMCGKTVGSFRRNVWSWLRIALLSLGYKLQERHTEGLIRITFKDHTNDFYIFSGKDESSQDLIQGITLAGVFFDEVALMPESFVQQATGRCSVTGSKFWFNCNPDSPEHWFKINWLDKVEEKNLLHLHFTLEDNLSLSKKIIERYKNMYYGVFFQRFILGLWVIAEGAIYDMFHDDNIYRDGERNPYVAYRRYIGVDYGTTNPMVFLEIFDDGNTMWVEREYYYDSKKEGVQKTDSQYAKDFDDFCGDKKPEYVIIDPSCASFKLELRNRGYRVREADNDVLNGIRLVSSLFGTLKLRIHKRCYNTISEHRSYVWDEKARKNGEEKPVKDKDHTCDALRYVVKTIIKRMRLK